MRKRSSSIYSRFSREGLTRMSGPFSGGKRGEQLVTHETPGRGPIPPFDSPVWKPVPIPDPTQGLQRHDIIKRITPGGGWRDEPGRAGTFPGGPARKVFRGAPPEPAGRNFGPPMKRIPRSSAQRSRIPRSRVPRSRVPRSRFSGR